MTELPARGSVRAMRLLIMMGALLVGSWVDPASATTLEERLYNAALAQPRAWYAPNSASPGARETTPEYEERVKLIAVSIATATRTERPDGSYYVSLPDWRWGAEALAAAVLTHWYQESRLALEVHAGEKHPLWSQDIGRSRCLGQMHIGGLVPSAEWERLAGVTEGATTLCAIWTARALLRMSLYCGGRATKLDEVLLPMFSGMSGQCGPTGPGRRKVERFAKIWREMRRPAPPRKAASASKFHVIAPVELALGRGPLAIGHPAG